ncbi:protein Malvolio-like [Copidosoma floridanum]|uniref:protein Malvolio-like n=1 Tax=Copidosoma floridanum TaxID=29053 RepID=UPI0006C9B6D1|nr:protein Malvolio-like [Copidosoma floridanum]
MAFSLGIAYHQREREMVEKLTSMKKQERDLLSLLYGDDSAMPLVIDVATTLAAPETRCADGANDTSDGDRYFGADRVADAANGPGVAREDGDDCTANDVSGAEADRNEPVDTYFSDQRIQIPDNDVHSTGFSFRKFWAFTGPGFLMSIAFLDPGNVESDLQAGTIASYKLLWVLSGATLLGLLMQRLSARLGVVTGLHLAEMCHRQFRTAPRILLWIMTEIAIIGSDMQEVIGTAIAIYLLSSKALPLWAGVLITILDTFTFLLLDKYGLRKLELLFGFFITVMAVMFGYEYAVSAPPTGKVVKGLVVPWCEGCDKRVLLQAVGIIGANVQPHNLHLHSALVKSREIDRREPRRVREANRYFFVEAAIALSISFFINLFVMSVFAQGLFQRTNSDVVKLFPDDVSYLSSFVQNNTKPVSADLYNGGVYLGCRFGIQAMLVWAVGLLASGQSSTMTGTYAGQFAMEGFLNLHWPRWRRVLLTRSVAILPTFLVAFYTNVEAITYFNDVLNVLMSLQLPFAALPVIAFTGNSRIMGEYKNGLFNNVAATTLSLAVIGINVYLVYTMVLADLTGLGVLVVVVVAVFYLLFCLYLIIYLAIGVGATSLNKCKIISEYVRGPMDGSLLE